MLKNKFKVFIMAAVSCAVICLTGVGLCIGDIAVRDNAKKNVYDEINQSPAYTEYYRSKIDEYYQEFK